MGPICLLNTGGPNKRNTIRNWMLAKFSTADAEAVTKTQEALPHAAL